MPEEAKKSTKKPLLGRRKTPKPAGTQARKPKILWAILLLAWTAVSLSMSQLLVGFPLYFILGDQFEKPFWTLIYYILNYALAAALIFLVPPAFLRWLSKKLPPLQKSNAETLAADLDPEPAELGVATAPTFVDLGLAPIAYIIYVFFANLLTRLFALMPWFNETEEQNVGFAHYLSGQDRIFAMLAIVFLAPLAEELIMRGWLYGKLRRKLSIFVSILFTSLLFALLHGQWNVGISVFILSVLLCTLREITGTVWAGVLLHILTNGIAFYILYVGI